MIGDPIFDKYYTSIIPVPTNQAFQEINMRNALIALLDKSGPAIVLTHSTGGLYGWSIADARPRLIKALIQVEPKGPPFREAIFSTRFTRPWGLTSIPLTYDPAPTDSTAPLTMKTIPTSDESRIDCILQEEPAKQLTNLREVPILIVTAEASYHATYDHSFKLFLEQAGCEKVEHLKLSDREIHGNGHLMFLEKNSDEIAGILEAWISGTVGKGGEAEGD
jgi:pimeloyl-ACP methyl ester carboxylesterase